MKQATKTVEQLKKQLRAARQRLKKERDAKETNLKLAKRQAKQLRKLRRALKPKPRTDVVAEGLIEWTMDTARTSRLGRGKRCFSPQVIIGGLSFRVSCKIRKADHYHYGVMPRIHCDATSSTYFAKVEYAVAKEDFVDKLVCRGSAEFNASVTEAEVEDPLNHDSFDMAVQCVNRLEGEPLTVKAHLRVIAYYDKAYAVFDSPDPLLSDVILVVGGVEFHVCRAFLAHFSEYFRANFFSGLADKENRIELPDFDAKQFEDMLRMFYPQRENTKANVEYLLGLADFFLIPVVTAKCREFLEKDYKMERAKKQQLREQYRLNGPKTHAAVADVSCPFPCLADVTLVAGGQEFRVNRKFIAHYSDHFKNLFFSEDSVEKGKDRILLSDVDAKDFRNLLTVIYPQLEMKLEWDDGETEEDGTEVSNVAGVLRLAARFGMQTVAWECTRYLIGRRRANRAKMLLLCEKFDLAELQHAILSHPRAIYDSSDCVAFCPDFNILSDRLKIALLLSYTDSLKCEIRELEPEFML